MCVCVCVRACACVRACVYVCVRACVNVSLINLFVTFLENNFEDKPSRRSLEIKIYNNDANLLHYSHDLSNSE